MSRRCTRLLRLECLPWELGFAEYDGEAPTNEWPFPFSSFSLPAIADCFSTLVLSLSGGGYPWVRLWAGSGLPPGRRQPSPGAGWGTAFGRSGAVGSLGAACRNALKGEAAGTLHNLPLPSPRLLRPPSWVGPVVGLLSPVRPRHGTRCPLLFFLFFLSFKRTLTGLGFASPSDLFEPRGAARRGVWITPVACLFRICLSVAVDCR